MEELTVKKLLQKPVIAIPALIVLFLGVVYFIYKIDAANSHSHGDSESHSHP